MTQDQKIIRTKVGLLEPAKQLGNASQGCKIMGYSKDSFYRFKELYETGGGEALLEMSRRRSNIRNQVATAIEEAVVEHFCRECRAAQKGLADDGEEDFDCLIHAGEGIRRWAEIPRFPRRME